MLDLPSQLIVAKDLIGTLSGKFGVPEGEKLQVLGNAVSYYLLLLHIIEPHHRNPTLSVSLPSLHIVSQASPTLAITCADVHLILPDVRAL